MVTPHLPGLPRFCRRLRIASPFRRSAVGSVLLLALVGAPVPVVAQFAFQGGPSSSDLFGADVQSSSNRTGLTGGGSYTLFHLGPVAVSPELFYAQRGAGETQLLVESPEFFEEVGLDYVEVPILARLNFRIPGTHDLLGASVSGGPAFAWNLNCSVRGAGEGQVALSDDCLLTDDGGIRTVVSSADRGLILSGGLDLDVFGAGNLLLGVRMVRGLVRVGNREGAGPDARNRAISGTLGYAFPFGDP